MSDIGARTGRLGGGLPLVVDGKIVGAIGVSGSPTGVIRRRRRPASML